MANFVQGSSPGPSLFIVYYVAATETNGRDEKRQRHPVFPGGHPSKY